MEEKNKPVKNYETYDLNGVEIFEAGRWYGKNSGRDGDVYTENDLDEMIKAHNEIGGKIKPPFKLGHDDNQKLAQKDGYPAIGWVTNLYRQGSKLLANLKKIPRKIYDLIVNKAYGRFSPEIMFNYADTSGDVKYKKVLVGLALLGADIPACDTINDFIDLYEMKIDDLLIYNQEQKVNFYEKKDDLKNENNIIKEDNQMDEIKKIQENYEKQLETKNSEIEQTKINYEKQINEKTDELNSLKLKLVEKDIENYLDKKVTEGIITPYQKVLYSALMLSDNLKSENNVKKYSYLENNENKTIEFSSDVELVKKVLDNADKKIDFKEESQDKKIDKKVYSNDVNDDDVKDNERDQKIQEYMKKYNVSYSIAFDNVIKEEVGGE